MNRNQSILGVLYHLYKKPLYSATLPSQSELRVLVVNFDDYGQKFLDACLQSGQIRQKKLKVTVVAEREEDRDEYLSARPSLQKFFNIDESLKGVNKMDSFGDVGFKIKFPGWTKERPEEFQELVETVAPHYAFIAVGSDGDNLELARKCKEVLDNLLKSCVVSYVHASPYFSPGKRSDATLSFAAEGSLSTNDDWVRPSLHSPESAAADVDVSPLAPKVVQDVFRTNAPLSESVVGDALNCAEFKPEQGMDSEKNGASLRVDSPDGKLLENVCGLAPLSVESELDQEAGTQSMSVFPVLDVSSPEDATVLVPVYVNADFEKMESFDEFERMALNTRLAACNTFYEERDKVLSDFRKPSVYYSCLSSVLSLKYKLFSVGIDLEALGYEGAAKKFAGKFSKISPNNAAAKELVWTEHRRWATEKLCLGYQTKSIEECLSDGKTEGPRSHVALVCNRPELRLETKEWKSRWNASYVDYSRLDDLDRVSLQLHHALVEKANERLKDFADPLFPNVFSDNNLSDVRAILEEVRGVAGKRQARQAFQEWFNCIRRAWQGEFGNVRQYARLKTAFLDAVKTMPTSKLNRRLVWKSVREFDQRFYPIWARGERRNWKREYLTLLDNIPFILTYSIRKTCLVVPFQTGGPSDLFANLGAVTLVAPEKVVYLFMPEKPEDREGLLKSLPRVAKYLENKQIQTRVELIVLLDDKLTRLDENDCNEIRNSAFKCSGGRIQTSCIRISGQDGLFEPLIERLGATSKEFPLFAIENNKTWLSKVLRVTGVVDRFPSFEFDSLKMAFHSLSRCDWLGYIRKSPSLSLSDVLTLSASECNGVNTPEFSDDYKLLWKLYSSSPESWKRFCDILYGLKESVNVTFLVPTINDSRLIPDNYSYTIHANDRRELENLLGNCRKVVNHLRKRGVIDEESSVEAIESNCSVKVRIVDPYKLRGAFDKLFKDYEKNLRLDADVVTFRRVADSVGVKVVLGELKIDRLPVYSPSVSLKDRDTINKMISIFGKDESLSANIHWGYSLLNPLLRDIKRNQDGTVSFFFVSRQARDLLTLAGKILELYTYYELKNTGNFDSVVSSCEINWEGANVVNEFDCIMIKGFRTFFVECKTRPLLDQNYYYKLDVLTRRFGVNAAAFLVADTRESGNFEVVGRNRAQRKRGLRMNVTTIYSVVDINDVGNKLAALCEK